MLKTTNLRAAGVPYLDQWFGYWAMYAPTLQSLYGKLSGLDLTAHMLDARRNRRTEEDPASEQSAAADAADPAGSASSEGLSQSVRRGYSYEIIDGIAVVSIDGTLMKHESSYDESTSTVMVRNTVRKITNDGLVHGAILKISSPGGSVAGAYDLADDIAALAAAKPTAAYIEDMGCSAAYLQAAQCSSISANRTALVGSIGTYGVVYDASRMYADAGVQVHVIRAGAHKGAGEPGTEITPEQLALWQTEIDDLNNHFIEAVAKGRRMSTADVRAIADGAAHIAAKAKTKQLIDRVESLDDLFSRMRQELDTGSSPARLQSTGRITADDHRGRVWREIDGPAQSTESIEADGRSAGDVEPTAQAGADAPGAETQETPMSQTATAPAGTPAAGSTVPKAASMKELKAACPGAPDSFLVDQAEAGATVQQAKDAFAEFQAARIRTLEAENKKLATKSAGTRARAEGENPEEDPEEPAAKAADPEEDPDDDDEPKARRSVQVRRPGAKPVSSQGRRPAAASYDGGDPVEAFNAAVADQMDKPGTKGDRKKSIAAVCKKNPELHEQFLLATNSGGRAANLIRERFAATP